MEVIDNFLPEDDFLDLQSLLLGEYFPWYYNDYVLTPPVHTPFNSLDYDDYACTNYQFIHLIYKDGDKSSFYSYVEPFITKLEVKDLFRIKANLNPKTLNHKYGGYHFDPYRKGKIGVYYVNDNNGGTQFKKGGKVNSVANRMVIFDANLEHTSVTCTDKKRRIVINFNYA
tara:strand:+ start:126 stop:638 length:513 start_codon:yes stop_codon:yes gene_type:complete